ncbi:MAG: hypothetical protein M9894_00460 [Planctomycetes bacterium]|nr:hypothetical protein [Planctomycetota bacterium]
MVVVVRELSCGLSWQEGLLWSSMILPLVFFRHLIALRHGRLDPMAGFGTALLAALAVVQHHYASVFVAGRVSPIQALNYGIVGIAALDPGDRVLAALSLFLSASLPWLVQDLGIGARVALCGALLLLLLLLCTAIAGLAFGVIPRSWSVLECFEWRRPAACLVVGCLVFPVICRPCAEPAAAEQA